MLRTLELLTEEIVAREPGCRESIHHLTAKLLIDTARAVTEPAPLPRATAAEDRRRQPAALLAGLKLGNDNTLLIRIYLEEKDVGSAIAALKARPSGPFYFGVFDNEDARIQVAKAAEAEYPDEAIAIYLSTAEKLIEQRNRGAYATACDYLAKLRALREEMAKAGLSK